MINKSIRIAGRMFFLTSVTMSLKEDYFEIKVRFTKDGIPLWTMTPDEVFKGKRKKVRMGNNLEKP